MRTTILEMTSNEWTSRRGKLAIDYAFADTPFGEVLVAATSQGICALFFVDDRQKSLAELRAVYPFASYTERMTGIMRDALSVFEPKNDHTITLHLKGTPFQLDVWRALMEIPRGELVTYSDIATRVGRPKACRATGSAVGANPVSVIIPCHRVVPQGGGTGNYRWGCDRKKALIESELERRIS